MTESNRNFDSVKLNKFTYHLKGPITVLPIQFSVHNKDRLNSNLSAFISVWKF